ncbi:MAG: hypothetical protein IH950_11935, partial [Bacteroidetes bacterium]|nr:hypothetical protein [Bacteroidota bacterium]
FLPVWKQAKEKNVKLPETSDTDYQSLETVLFHVFRASRGYIKWICEKLNLPEPGIDSPPALEVIEKKADSYLEHLLEKWRDPLKELDEKVFLDKSYLAKWGVEYCIDAMLEHAVMHTVRHEFQLTNLIAGSK